MRGDVEERRDNEGKETYRHAIAFEVPLPRPLIGANIYDEALLLCFSLRESRDEPPNG